MSLIPVLVDYCDNCDEYESVNTKVPGLYLHPTDVKLNALHLQMVDNQFFIHTTNENKFNIDSNSWKR